MNTKKLLTINIVLYIIGALISIYLVYNHWMLEIGDPDFVSFCTINQSWSCDLVNASKYAKLFGVPIAIIALSYYLFGIIVALIGMKNTFVRRESLILIVSMAAVSALVAVILIPTMIFVIKSLCLMCIGIHTVDILIFIVALLDWKSMNYEGSFIQQLKSADLKKMLYFVLGGLACFLIVLVVSTQFKPSAKSSNVNATDTGPDKDAFTEEFKIKPIEPVEIGNSPSMGLRSENPPIQIIEFADFQCPACAVASKRIEFLLDTYKDKIQLIFKSFPFDMKCNNYVKSAMHEFSCQASKAALCLADQGKFAEIYKKFFNDQPQMNNETIKQWAKELGADMGMFEKCVNSNETQARITKDIEQAVVLGIKSTPTFFINGKRVEGIIDEVRFKKILEILGK